MKNCNSADPEPVNSLSKSEPNEDHYLSPNFSDKRFLDTPQREHWS